MTTSSKEELRGLLTAMGATIAANSRLNEDELERKLRLAIGYAQNMSEFAVKLPFNPIQLPVWQGETPMLDAFRRTNLAEALAIGRAEQIGGDANTAFPLFENTLMDLRQTFMSLATQFDAGRRVALLQDEGQQERIALRMLGVYALGPETPLISLIYEVAHSPEMMTTGKMESSMRTQVNGVAGAQITCTLQELALVRRLLRLNSTKVAPEYEANIAPNQRGFQRSFIIPIVPLDKVQVGKVLHNPGCTVCGSAGAKNCSACKIERYCSSACQRIHWKEHKEACRNMQGGTWTDFTFTDAPTFNGRKLHVAIIGTSSAVSKIPKAKTYGGDGEADPPLNKHGDRAFLIKIQRIKSVGMPGVPPVQIFYDRLRTLNGCLEQESNTLAWPAFEQQLPPEMIDVKMYCWARRTSDWTLSICLDRHPNGRGKPQW